MSQYLVSRILAAANIEVRLRTEVVGARGDGHLEAVTLADRDAGTEEEVETSWLFVFIGAAPRTDWLGDAVARDGRGFVLTGPDLPPGPDIGWPLERGAVRPGDERARRLRRRRRPPRQHEAGRLRRRRGRHVRLPRPPLPGDDLMLYDELRALPLLDGFTDEQVADLAASGEEVSLEAGEHLFDEGRPADDWWVLLEGTDRPRPPDRPRGGGDGHDGGARASGPAASGPGTSTGSTWAAARVIAPSRVFRLPAERLGRARRGVVPVRRPPAARPDRDGAAHRAQRPPARGPRGARHPGGRARARDQQPRLRRGPLGGRAPGEQRRPLRLAAAAGRRGHHRRAVRRPRRAAAVDRRGRRADRRRAGRARGRAVDWMEDHAIDRGLGDRACAGRRGRGPRLVRAGGRRARGSGPAGGPGVGGQRGDHHVVDRRGPGRRPGASPTWSPR